MKHLKCCCMNYIVSGGCGSKWNENNTYFESSGDETMSCVLEVCKCQSNVCQLRLDFDSFVIAGPSTSSVSSIKLINGVVSTGGLSHTVGTQCLEDTFSVTNPGGKSPPQICGINTGEHMYVDASDQCNQLAFQLGMNQNNRQWNIKITQYSCDYDNLAPKGCTQYHFGESTGLVRTFNYQGGVHLANQNQAICVRQEEGQCRICWSALADQDFGVSGTVTSMNYIIDSICCGHGYDGNNFHGFDCAIFGAGVATTNPSLGSKMKHESVCGRGAGLPGRTTNTGTGGIHTCSFAIHYADVIKMLDYRDNAVQHAATVSSEICERRIRDFWGGQILLI